MKYPSFSGDGPGGAGRTALRPAAACRRPNRRESAFSLVELVVSVSILMTLAAIAYTAVLSALVRAHEASAVASLRTIRNAEEMYFITYESGYSDDLEELGPPDPGDPPSEDAADLIPPDLASGTKSGYRFNYQKVGTIPSGGKKKGKKKKKIKAVLYTVTAEPLRVGTSGNYFFYTDETGVIRSTYKKKASTSSPPI